MTSEDQTRRIEDIESKLEELSDMELTNKIEVLELKSLLKSLQAGVQTQPAGQGSAPPLPGPVPLSKDVVKSVENLYRTINGIQKRLDMLTQDLDSVRRTQNKPLGKPPAPVAPLTPAPVVGELRISEIRSKIDEAKRIMGGQ
ncbi:MAG: hypothetical protein HY366_02875 [Candidatus Aenigmarchaeota archaeon]|nr:hypothetical protein [Candidatus Aenigmarchaeota archaeon]